ncbi:zinc-dependent sulfurtransferase SufU [Microcystis aeruginosa NIES-2520]|jgi:nitrogen fixation NifU-like protein|uniref:Zinc-dependent sulfurtransferase SufU n=1 Tax=Microcystis aeruginosa NIES-2520 TaxID=2303982 RepID=A0A5A5RBA2_MICAE|nr:SUF system NifU family Fe-S cluster assembly protein [Microcystis aeruginosa]GCA73803.1 zinc-dependent sulfurtransferase SufU [Microcystis aeruginosa NIES-2520]
MAKIPMITLDNRHDLYQRVILDHYKKPRHKGRTSPVHRQQQGRTPYCGDTIELTVKLNQTGDTIEDVQFEGEGCSVALASADLMADAIRGLSIVKALETVEQFLAMMEGIAEFPEEPKQLNKLNVMQALTHPLRLKCAKLAWYTLKAALE